MTSSLWLSRGVAGGGWADGHREDGMRSRGADHAPPRAFLIGPTVPGRGRCAALQRFWTLDHTLLHLARGVTSPSDHFRDRSRTLGSCGAALGCPGGLVVVRCG